MNEYYIYFHINKTTGKVFYVGKGKDRRAWRKEGRSYYWNNIVNKYEYEIYIIHENLSEKRALDWEKLYISMFGRENLCNLTNGGEGTSGKISWNKGKKHTKEHIEKMKEKLKGRIFSDEWRKKLSEAAKKRHQNILQNINL